LGSAELHDPASNTWSPAASLAATRYNHTATLLPSGKLLIAGGYNGTSYLSSAELYDPTTNIWTSVGSLTAARNLHTASLLPSGQVLVTGGNNGASISSAELFDPATSTWSSAGSLTTARQQHTATVLPSGNVMVAGGLGGGISLNSAEIYDATSNAWSSGSSFTTGRHGHSATLLPSGKVLVAGGLVAPSTYLNSAQLYDAASNTWSSVGSLATTRFQHSATLLPSGKVLVGGGFNGSFVNGAELYDPASSTWSSAGILATSRHLHGAVLLASGKVLVAAGVGPPGANGTTLSSTELYDYASSSWSSAGSFTTARASHAASLLPSGKVFIVGGLGNGGGLSSAALYDPANNTWSATAGLGSLGRNGVTATLLLSGKVLVAGGQDTGGSSGDSLRLAALYDPINGSWKSVASMALDRFFHTATLMPSGKVLVVGGFGHHDQTSAELYDPAANTWSGAGNMTWGRVNHSATLLPSGKVLVAAGQDDLGTTFSSAELYDPATNSWAPAGNLAAARYSHSATLLPSGKVLVAGGATSGGDLSSAELYDPATNSWSPAGSFTTARSVHSGTLLPSGKVVLAGGFSANIAVNSTALYDPAGNSWSSAGSLVTARSAHTATLLLSGQVLASGGITVGGSAVNSAELFLEDLGIADARRPVVTAATDPVLPAASITVTGTGFTGDSEASGGAANSSATHYPLLQLRRVDNDQIAWVSPATNSTRSATSYQSAAVPSLPKGEYLLTVIVNGLASRSIMVALGVSNQTISFGPPPTLVFGGTGTVTATATSGLPVSYSTASSACTVNANSGLVTVVTLGSCVIAADQGGSPNFLAAAQVTQTITIGPANQTISFGAPPTLVYGGSGTVSATATSGLPVTFGTTSPACTVNASTGLVNTVAAGACVIAADQPGNGNYNAASQVTQSLTVGIASQSISFTSVPALGTGGTATITAVASSGLAVSYTTSSTACSVNLVSGLITAVATGPCVIAANQAGNGNFLAAPQVTQSIFVTGGSQSLIFGTAPGLTAGSSGSLSATSDKGVVPVTLTRTTPSVCTISGGTVTGIIAGTCTIQANQAGNGTYGSATANLSFTVLPSPAVCNLHMDSPNPLLATVEGLILTRAMLGFTGSAVTAGTGIATPWETIRDNLNAKCGTAFQ
jgi:N-acetylneuraminic acid mutarotase